MITNINKRISQIIELNKNVKLIELNYEAINKIKPEIMDMLDKRGIFIEIVNSNTELKAYTYKTDCFAYIKKGCCYALEEMDCVDCAFYNNQLNRKQIEWTIKKYEKEHNE